MLPTYQLHRIRFLLVFYAEALPISLVPFFLVIGFRFCLGFVNAVSSPQDDNFFFFCRQPW